MRRYWLKLLTLWLLGILPGGEAVYRRLQNGVLRSTALDDDTLSIKTAVAKDYLHLISAQGPVTSYSPHLDIGAGWHPIIPLLLRAEGIPEHILADIAPLLRVSGIPAVAARLGQSVAAESTKDILKELGFRYFAPACPPYPLADGSVGLVTCTTALSYPPPSVVRAIHSEAARVLRPGGLYLATVGLIDYFALSLGLPRFLFLRYSEGLWRRLAARMITPLNRLRAADHRALFDGLPFTCLEWRLEGPGAADLAELVRSRPHAEWRQRFSDHELAHAKLVWLMRRD